jgi:Protein of unknown function (DUF1364)
MNLRKLAKGKDCQVRVPGVCCGERDTTVLAHLRLPGITGFGIKAPDLLGAYACHACHSVVDGQQKSRYSREELKVMFYEGIFRTQHWLIREGFIKW